MKCQLRKEQQLNQLSFVLRKETINFFKGQSNSLLKKVDKIQTKVNLVYLANPALPSFNRALCKAQAWNLKSHAVKNCVLLENPFKISGNVFFNLEFANSICNDCVHFFSFWIFWWVFFLGMHIFAHQSLFALVVILSCWQLSVFTSRNFIVSSCSRKRILSSVRIKRYLGDISKLIDQSWHYRSIWSIVMMYIQCLTSHENQLCVENTEK